MSDSLLQQIKARRLALGLKQKDMPPRVDMARQQYQRLESGGNPRLDTLTLVAAGLNSELMLIPAEKVGAVLAVLGSATATDRDEQGMEEDPWQGLLGDKE